VDSPVAFGNAGRREFRTAPLWGWRFRKNGMMHDGRVWSIDDAIHLHGGDAVSVRDAYFALTSGERGYLQKFLVSR
jgi:CxxC motif-containing protein (DUF1111 family)